MSAIFSETNMEHALKKYLLEGESLQAGIHAVAKESLITAAFEKCVRTESKLLPDENGGAITLFKKKYSAYDIYIGITESSLIIAECEENSHFYQFDDNPNTKETTPQIVASPILLADIGTHFSLTDIQDCKIKKGWMGSVNCFITMKNGSYFKLCFPKLGGLGGGMPHHAEYREAIIQKLSRP